jgi:hypothetical protein
MTPSLALRKRRLDLRHEVRNDIAAPAQESGEIAVEGEIGQQPVGCHVVSGGRRATQIVMQHCRDALA